MIELETERLTLRIFRQNDFERYAAICANPEVMRYLNYDKTLTRLEAWQQMAMFIGHWRLRGYGIWAVEERKSRNFVGRIGFFNPEGWPGFELGWVLGRKYWGKGYAREGARRALAYAFTEMAQEHVISLIHPDNHRSIRVAEQIGERLEGRTELLGQEVLIYGIDREGWGAT
jgi:RimJ/RimL family protein N-acetyltransferase